MGFGILKWQLIGNLEMFFYSMMLPFSALLDKDFYLLYFGNSHRYVQINSIHEMVFVADRFPSIDGKLNTRPLK